MENFASEIICPNFRFPVECTIPAMLQHLLFQFKLRSKRFADSNICFLIDKQPLPPLSDMLGQSMVKGVSCQKPLGAWFQNEAIISVKHIMEFIYGVGQFNPQYSFSKIIDSIKILLRFLLLATLPLPGEVINMDSTNNLGYF